VVQQRLAEGLAAGLALARVELRRRGDRLLAVADSLAAAGRHGTLVLDGADCAVSGGTIFSYGPGIPQDIATDPRQTLVKYFVDFTGTRARDLLVEFAPAPGSVVQTTAPGEILAIFDDLIRCGLRPSPHRERLAALLLESLIVRIAESAIPRGAAHSRAFENYRRCRQVIEDGWPRLHSLEAIAAACHIDSAYLCRLFQRFDHLSPYQFLLRLKMTHAAAMLQSPGATVKEVAAALDFRSVCYSPQ
jgi:AraC-like DNA-binding protein